jgi:hypothetical protein
MTSFGSKHVAAQSDRLHCLIERVVLRLIFTYVFISMK